MMTSNQPASDRRRHRRVPVKLRGRYMLPDRSEHVCDTIDISPSGLMITGESRPYRGERVVVYLEEVGRIEGIATRVVKGGFAMTISATPRKREQLDSILTRISNSEGQDMEDRRQSERVIPARTATIMTLDDGKSYPISVENFSATGASIKTNIGLSIEAVVIIGKHAARVSRLTENGFGVEFIKPLNVHEFNAGFDS